MFSPGSRLGHSVTFAIAAVIAAQTLPAFASAPQQLHNKTIQLSWSASVDEHDASGQAKHVNIASSRLIYVSNAGRLFERARRWSGRKSKGGDNAPDSAQNKGGEARGLSFQGSKLVGTIAWLQGAMRYVVSFDSSFSSCTVEVTFGREGGGARRVGLNGAVNYIDSEAASGQSCSIREGNPFAAE